MLDAKLPHKKEIHNQADDLLQRLFFIYDDVER
jgi:hypothetical protein